MLCGPSAWGRSWVSPFYGISEGERSTGLQTNAISAREAGPQACWVKSSAAEGEWNCWAYFSVNEDRLYPIFLPCIDFIILKSDGSGIFARALCALFCCLILIKCGIVLDVL